ncbi:transposase, partial [Micromonospora endophytica]
PPPVAPAPVTPAAVAGPPVPAPPSRPESAPSRIDGPSNRPISTPPPPPPGITPIAPAQRGSVPPAEAGEPFRPTLTTAAINSARAERQRTVIPPRPKTNGEPPAPTGGFSATDLSVPIPTHRPGQEPAPPGSRANWPLVNNPENPADSATRSPVAGPYEGSRRAMSDTPAEEPTTERRVTPPWLADDLPPEPPVLRLVEPPPLADRALRTEAESQLETPPLRLVERSGPARAERPVERLDAALPARRPEPPVERRPPPISDEGDGDLLIFAQAKSAWFVGHGESAELDWSSLADTGWQAAEQAARPAVGDATNAGLPKRVPQANLVPGSPLREERPLRIVRDAASLAENTTGYFRGWRRGQEIGGFAVGGRPGRESAGGWDFTRDTGDRDDDREYEYRSAGYRS